MTETRAAPAWMAKVEEMFAALRHIERAAQEAACEAIADRPDLGREAADKLRKMFEAERAKVAKLVEAVEEPTAAGWRFVQRADGSKWRVRGTDWRRHFGPMPQLKVIEARKPEPESEPEAKPQPEEDVKKPPPATIKVVRDEEDEPREPVVSRLAIAPGLVGEVADFTLGSAMYPSVRFAVGGSIPLIGTLIGRRIAGPSGPLGTGTHLYLVLVGPTGCGKEHIRTVTKLLLTTVSAAELIGPGRFKSGAAIISHLIKKPLSLCVMDEFGAMLARFSHPNAQFYHQDETEILRELWGINWGRYDSPEGANADSEAVVGPALSLIGMSTPKELYKACKSRDVTNGFLNRWMFIEEKVAPAYQRVSGDALKVPKELKMGLSRLYQPGAVLLDQPMDGSECRPSFRMGWGRGAEEIYDSVRQSVEQETDDRKRELFWRSPEKTVRIATSVAAGCLSKTVNRDHMEWARQFVSKSDETLLVGVQEYMEEEKLEFGDLCREIIRRVKREGGSMSRRDVGRSFQNDLRFGPELRRAIDHLVDTKQLIEWKEETGGRPSWWLELPKPNR